MVMEKGSVRMDEKVRVPAPQEIYRHFKGNYYQVVTMARDTESGEPLVIYQALYGEFGIWARTLQNFTEELDPAKYPNALQGRRFERVDRVGDMPAEVEHSDTARPVREGGRGDDAELAKESEPAGGAEEETLHLDPLVEQYLDADSNEERLNILSALRPRVTNDMIDVCAMASGVEIDEGDVQERWQELRDCLLTIDHYEQSRSRFHDN